MGGWGGVPGPTTPDKDQRCRLNDPVASKSSPERHVYRSRCVGGVAFHPSPTKTHEKARTELPEESNPAALASEDQRAPWSIKPGGVLWFWVRLPIPGIGLCIQTRAVWHDDVRSACGLDPTMRQAAGTWAYGDDRLDGALMQIPRWQWGSRVFDTQDEEDEARDRRHQTKILDYRRRELLGNIDKRE